jgi:hypothetical protein
MTETEFQALVLDRYGLRIENRMAKYALEKLALEAGTWVIGQDARTGVPRRLHINKQS